jgi:hypothetical protein
MTVDLIDPRWGGYAPWFLRYEDFKDKGNFDVFFSLVSKRLETALLFDALGISNLLQFGAKLESESLQRFRFDSSYAIAAQVSQYFDPITIQTETESHFSADEKLAAHLLEITAGRTKAKQEGMHQKQSSIATYHSQLVLESLSVLECFLRIIPDKRGDGFNQLIRDIKRFLAAANILLDINTTGPTPVIVPMEETLIQQQVIDKLLPRLSQRLPERGNELISAYHSMLEGKSADSIFAEAFKTLEAIARDLTGDKNFVFDKSCLNNYYKSLHPTIHNTLIQLAAHRGDKASHGKDAPAAHEIRYVLFAICNSALLLLDYPRPPE